LPGRVGITPRVGSNPASGTNERHTDDPADDDPYLVLRSAKYRGLLNDSRGELASKSRGGHPPCGFDSHLRHLPSLAFASTSTPRSAADVSRVPYHVNAPIRITRL
jgi:hypothetical protein